MKAVGELKKVSKMFLLHSLSSALPLYPRSCRSFGPLEMGMKDNPRYTKPSHDCDESSE